MWQRKEGATRSLGEVLLSQIEKLITSPVALKVGVKSRNRETTPTVNLVEWRMG